MRYLTTASLFALIAFAIADETLSDVISLSAADFETVVNAEPLALVEFFAPWSALQISTSSFLINSIGADTAKPWLLITRKLQLLSRRKTSSLPKLTVLIMPTFVRRRVFKVTREFSFYAITTNVNMTLRTLKVYRNGQSTEYNGPRNADGIVSYMIK